MLVATCCQRAQTVGHGSGSGAQWASDLLKNIRLALRCHADLAELHLAGQGLARYGKGSSFRLCTGCAACGLCRCDLHLKLHANKALVVVEPLFQMCQHNLPGQDGVV